MEQFRECVDQPLTVDRVRKEPGRRQRRNETPAAALCFTERSDHFDYGWGSGHGCT